MLRYVALVWDSRNQQQGTAAQLAVNRLEATGSPWIRALDQPGLLVITPDANSRLGHSIRLPDGQGVVLGTLFERPASSSAVSMHPCTSVRATEADRLFRTNGESIIRLYWGSYVLFLRDPDARAVTVFRSPMAVLPCFHAVFRGLHVFFSSVPDCVSTRLFAFSINWDCIRAQAACGDYLTNQTALNGLDNLICGESVRIFENKLSRKLVWRPSHIANQRSVRTFGEAVSLVRAQTLLSVSAWASLHKDVIVLLSGGLDSAIVLSCLTRLQHKPNITCVNFHSRDAGDERRFARTMAQRCGVGLIERERATEVDLRMFLDCSRTANPVLNYSACDIEPTCIQLSQELNTSAVFNGELGDNLFGQNIGPEAIAAYMWRNGFGLGLKNVLIDYALLRRVSFWRALKDGIHALREDKRLPYWSMYLYFKNKGTRGGTLVTREVIESYERSLAKFIHPWMFDMASMPPGKFLLVYGALVVTSTAYHSPFAGADDSLFVAPLASQPLVEASLQIPSYFTVHGGRDRAVARAAFAQDLTQEILDRGTGKGTTSIWLRDLVERNKPLMRELLLDGVLVRERILDRKQVEEVLTGEVNKSMNHVADTIEQLYIEAWVRNWMNFETRAAA
jgi:asparagine synthase (glutamine-hydrolysing)